VKAAKRVAQKKSAGTLAVERHRPLMNKLSGANRRRLHRRAAELLYGSKSVSVRERESGAGARALQKLRVDPALPHDRKVLECVRVSAALVLQKARLPNEKHFVSHPLQ
jgi:hypothetical protein